jgi:hypothetical protein
MAIFRPYLTMTSQIHAGFRYNRTAAAHAVIAIPTGIDSSTMAPQTRSRTTYQY